MFHIKDFEEKDMPEILKKWDQFTAISDLQNNVERVLFQAGQSKGNSVTSFQRTFTVPKYLRTGSKSSL